MNSEMKQKQAALVIGAGDATGGAIARRFAREGMIACVTRRSAGSHKQSCQVAGPGRGDSGQRRRGGRLRIRCAQGG
jgi:NAD(P)-dependent dehydrogenase (short-subunit alcohol dehydrogenase family)